MTDLAALDAAILAGGLGTRLASVTGGRQKVVAEVGGRPFLDYVLAWLRREGLRRVVLMVGHDAESVERFAETWSDLEIVVSREPARLGTGGALRFALPHLRSDRVLVANGDSLAMAPLRAMAALDAEMVMATTAVEDAGRYGAVEIDGGRVVGFREKGRAGPGAINAGIYLMRRSVIEAIPEGVVSLEQDVFPTLLGPSLRALPCPPGFIDIGTPESFARAPEVVAAWDLAH